VRRALAACDHAPHARSCGEIEALSARSKHRALLQTSMSTFIFL
jgi:hypothetical protein